jgi:hypothetical protein
MGWSERKAELMPRRVLPFGAFLFGIAGIEREVRGNIPSLAAKFTSEGSILI